MSSKFQNLSFALSLFFSVYLIAHAVPAHVERRFVPDSLPTAPIPQAVEEPVPTPAPSQRPTEAIQIKASGEEPEPMDEETRAYLAVRQEFEKRFGHAYDEAWLQRDSIHYSFPVPEGIRNMVDFWIQVFGRYGQDQYLFHHKDYVGIVYAAIDLSGLNPDESGLSPEMSTILKEQFLLEEKIRVRNQLALLTKKLNSREPLTTEETRLVELFSREGPVTVASAANAENIRVQGGFKHRFRQAIRLSGLYMKEMENIFTMKGLPVELTRIPFVESAFNIRAVSSAEAIGLWQFIYSTGKQYLKIDSIVDERLDPILATYAAAEHLKKEYQLLGSWPLTVNAYNTGPGRMLRAKRELKTDDIATIIQKFEDPGYQFYSRNYYPEFMAAVHVYENAEQFFGKIEKLPPFEYELFMPPNNINLRLLAESVDVDPERLRQMNPAFSEKILGADFQLPAGYMVKVPRQYGPLFSRAAVHHQNENSKAQWHIVEEGETLESIAERYQIPVLQLEEINRFLPDEELNAGTVIKLPREIGVAMNPEEKQDIIVQ